MTSPATRDTLCPVSTPYWHPQSSPRRFGRRVARLVHLGLALPLLLAPLSSVSARAAAARPTARALRAPPASAGSTGAPQGIAAQPPPPAPRVLTGPVVSQPVRPADTRSLPPARVVDPSRDQAVVWEARAARPLPGPERSARAFEVPGAAEREPAGYDPLVQRMPGAAPMPATLQNFEGVSNINSVLPPDTDGQVGPNHYVQMVNLSTAIYDKAGNLLYGPFRPNTLWPDGDPCRVNNHGDVVVLYDQLADRWLLTQFALPDPYYECIAVSKGPVPTNDPNDWYPYTFLVHPSKANDYPKLGIWPDGYSMSVNQFTGGEVWGGAGVFVFDRARMLNGDPATFQYFDVADINLNYGGLLPSHLMGSATPPPGAPNTFASVDMNWSGTDDVLHLFEFHVDWNTPAHSTFAWVRDLLVAPFDWHFDGSGGPRNNWDIPQPGTAVELDSLSDRLMMHLWYRNFGTHESLVTNHTVNVGGIPDHAGIRWYEVRGGAIDTTFADAVLHQQGTYAPDGEHRWMGSIAQDHAGNIALGYSVSSGSVSPAIRYAGRLAGDPVDTLPQAEAEIIAGGGSQTHTSARWGDYSAMSVDPVDDCTFWYTQEYIAVTGSAPWRTRIASFRFPNCSGELGTLEGAVYEAGGTPLDDPIASAQVAASASPTATFETLSTSDGSYQLALPTGSYTLTAMAYGYHPTTIAGVSVVSTTTTTQNITLTTAATYVVSGTVTDAATGWPLYAAIAIEGDPLSPPAPYDSLWNDPVSGHYSVTLSEGITYTFEATAWAPGYDVISRQVGPLTAGSTENLTLTADLSTCSAPGYAGGPGGCAPVPGGLVIGNVSDLNTLDPLNGAVVSNDGGFTATAAATPAGAATGDGFYTLFSPAGTGQFTATMAGYGTAVTTTNVVQSDTVRQDFALPAGRLHPTPSSLALELPLGTRITVPLTLSNTGGRDLQFELSEQDLGYAPQAPTSVTQVTVPASDDLTWDRDVSRLGKRPWPQRPEISFAVEQASQLLEPVAVLLLTPDPSPALITATLAAFSDLDVSLWRDAGAGDPTGETLAAYDVVVVGNDWTWDTSGMTPEGVGDALADYLDGGGKVVDTLFVHDHLGWELAGRYIEEGYAPLTTSSDDMTAVPYSLGTIYEPAHPILSGVTSVVDNPTVGIGHQDVGLASGARRLADWNDGEVFIAYNDRVIGVNQLWFQGANWSGDVPALMHNAILYLASADLDWVAADPVSGTIPATGRQLVSVTLDAGALSVTRLGQYLANLKLANDTPYGQAGIRVTMTVTASASHGPLVGSITSRGYCGTDPAPLAWAHVRVTSTTGTTRTVQTGDDGRYEMWLDEGQGPFTVTAVAPGHSVGLAAGVAISGQMTTTLDFALDWLAPCLGVDPVSLEEDLLPGETVTHTFTISNGGAAGLDWQRVETGCLPVDATWATSEPLSGTLPAHSRALLTITLGTSNPGLYAADLCLSSSDPISPHRNLPLTLTVWWSCRLPIALRNS